MEQRRHGERLRRALLVARLIRLHEMVAEADEPSQRKKRHRPQTDMQTLRPFARRDGRSMVSLRALCAAGQIPGAKKVGRDWLVPRDAVAPRGAVLVSPWVS